MYVFTYGTLKKGFSNHYWMEDINAKFIGTGDTEKKFTMVSVDDMFPGMIDGNNSINGEVYEIDQKGIYHLDKLEGYPSLYNRRKIKVNVKGTVYEAIAYILTYTSDFSEESDLIKKMDNGSLKWVENEYWG